MDALGKQKIEMHTLLLCDDIQFRGITRTVLNELHAAPRIVGGTAAALTMIQSHEFDAIIVDWREIDNLSDFLCAVRRSELNRHAVLVAIVRDLLDLKQAFAAGVQLLIHKPASAVQIERCLRAAYSARIAQRRRHHREPVSIVASVSMRNYPLSEVLVVNLGDGGLALKMDGGASGHCPKVGEDVDLRFALPRTGEIMDVSGRVVWGTADACGVRFNYVPDNQRQSLEQWLTACVERSLAELCERIRVVCA
jgi:CheY-like chemotaxis protein